MDCASVVGDGLVIIHNTMVPCAVTENLADYVVAMEWAIGRPRDGGAAARLAFPLEWAFAMVRARASSGVIGYGWKPWSATPRNRSAASDDAGCLLTGIRPLAGAGPRP